MLTGIGLRNFKRFGGPEVAYVPLGSRVTLLLGANSAGKSSLIQALLLLKQSWSGAGDASALLPEGPEVHLGSAQNLVHLQRRGGTFDIAVDQRYSGGVVRRLWVSCRPTEGGTARVERFGWALDPELPARDHGRQSVRALAGTEAVRGDDIEWAGVTLPSFELIARSVAAGISPALDAWRDFLPDDPHGPDPYMSVSVALALTNGQPTPLLRAQLADAPPEPQPPRGGSAAHAPQGTQGAHEEGPGPGLAVDPEQVARELLEFEEAHAAWSEQQPVWARARELVAAIGDPLTRSAVRGELVSEAVPLAVNVPQGISDVINSVSHIRYIGPVRSPSTRWASLGRRVLGVGTGGELAVELLAQDGEVRLRDGAWRVEGPLLAAVNRALGAIGVEYLVEVWATDPAAGPASATVRLRQEHAGGVVRVGLLDVGSGIRQVLPILVEYEFLRMQMDSGESPAPWLLAIEQPELHLHPRLQGDLLMWLAGMERSEEGGEYPLSAGWRRRAGPSPQVIIETHGEILALRGARLVRSGLAGETEVVCLAVGPDDEDDYDDASTGVRPATVVRVRPTLQGWRGWPRNLGFFGERHLEVEE